MRMLFAMMCTMLALLFGGMGVANATPAVAGPDAPVATSTTLADDDVNGDDDSGKQGLWGLAGLLGLLGLLGLRRRNDTYRGPNTPGIPGNTGTPGTGPLPGA
jgi:MYXO-CTERM domain-containing protein